MSEFDQEVSALRTALKDKFADYVNQDITNADYQKALQSYSTQFPDAFKVIQDQNTDAKINQLNINAFSDPVIGNADRAINDLVDKRLQVMYGTEDEESLFGQLLGLNSNENKSLWVTGKGNEATQKHEGLHALQGDVPIKSIVSGREVGKELLARSFDALRAFITGDEKLKDETSKFVKGQYGRSDLMSIALGALKEMHDVGVIPSEATDNAELNKALAYFDGKEQGILDSLFSDPEPVTQIKQSTMQFPSQEGIQALTQVMGVADNIKHSAPTWKDSDVIVDLNRTGLEPTI